MIWTSVRVYMVKARLDCPYDDAAVGSTGAVSWMGEKPYLADEAVLRGGERPMSESPLDLALGRPLVKGFSV